MHKSLRSLVLVATVILTVTPALHAGVTGTDPRPAPAAVVAPSLAQRLLSFFNF